MLEIRHQEVNITYYMKRKPIQCPECKQIYSEGGGQAVVCQSQAKGLAYLRCRECGHRFALAVKEV